MHNRLDEAEKVLARARKAVPDDDVLKTAHGDVQLMRLRRAIDAWKKKVKEHPEDKDAREKLAQIHEKLATYELAEFRRRVEARPEDSAPPPPLRPAAGHPRQARRGHRRVPEGPVRPRAEAPGPAPGGPLVRGQGAGQARREELRRGPGPGRPDDLKLRNALRYRLGRVCEAQGKLKEAEEYYNEVAAEDYTYEDVADRLQALNKKAQRPGEDGGEGARERQAGVGQAEGQTGPAAEARRKGKAGRQARRRQARGEQGRGGCRRRDPVAAHAGQADAQAGAGRDPQGRQSRSPAGCWRRGRA